MTKRVPSVVMSLTCHGALPTGNLVLACDPTCLRLQADEAAGKYNAAGMRLDGLQHAAVTWTSRHAVDVPAN